MQEEWIPEPEHRRFWVGVVSASHVRMGVHGEFAQLCHGTIAEAMLGDVGGMD